MRKNKVSRFKGIKIFVVLISVFMLASFAVSSVLAFSNFADNETAFASYDSFDSYGCINTQSQMQNFKFGFWSYNRNGCGTIALYNVLNLASKTVPLPNIIKSMDFFGQNAYGFLGTNPISMVFYLRSKGIDAYISFEAAKFDEIASTSSASIFAYASFKGGHYETLLPLGNGDYKVFNPSKQATFEELLEDTQDSLIRLLIYTKY